MRIFSLACLAALVLTTSLAELADAGRRRRRRVAVAAGVVAATARRPTVVAVTPVRRVAPTTAVAQPHPVVRLPDLTVTEMVAEGDLHCITVKNIGQATSPTTTLQLKFRRSADRRLVATKQIRVLPLRVHQSIRFRLHALPHGPVQLIAEVDPDHRVAEINEKNNGLTLTIAGPPPALEPAPSEVIVVDIDINGNINNDINDNDANGWVAPEVNEGRSVRGTAQPDRQE